VAFYAPVERIMDEWQERAKRLYTQTQLSLRVIASTIGIPKSTVHDFITRNGLQRGYPKVLVFDIETAPGTCYYWRRKTTYINKEMVIEKPGRVLTWAAKWLRHEDVMSDSILAYGDVEDDFKVCESLWHLLDEADIVIAHNGDRFDIKMINARFLAHGLPPTSPYTSIDTLKIARKYFGFDSNRLDELGQDLGIGRKMGHDGMSLWIRCLNGDREAFDTMLRYNEQDVLLLEELYLKVRPYHKTHPNVSLYSENEQVKCSKCGSDNVRPSGKHVYSSATRYQLYKCTDCNGFSRGRVSDKTTAQRGNILASS
jgi:transposase-like protein